METMTKLIKKLTTLTEEEREEAIAEYLETLELEEIKKLHAKCEEITYGFCPPFTKKYYIILKMLALCELYEF